MENKNANKLDNAEEIEEIAMNEEESVPFDYDDCKRRSQEKHNNSEIVALIKLSKERSARSKEKCDKIMSEIMENRKRIDEQLKEDEEASNRMCLIC